MIFVIENATPIKEMVARINVNLYEIQGNKRVPHSEYAVALDLQPYVTAENIDQGVKVAINGDALMQELVNSIGAMQLTANVARQLTGVEWQVINEEPQTEEEQTEEDAIQE